MQTARKKIIIDTDTASDDAVALVMALREPTLQVLAITTVAGNVPLELATKNACLSVTYAGGARPPIYPGADRPLCRPLRCAEGIHGKDGMGDQTCFRAPEVEAERTHAVDAILRLVREGEGDVEIVTLGPLTNLALAILQEPETMKRVPRIIAMGGAAFYGNTSPTAEFNFWVDAEAADIVCRSGIPLTIATIEACHGAGEFGPQQMAELEAASERGWFCVTCNDTMLQNSIRSRGYPQIGLPDPIALAALTRPELITGSFDAHVRVETQGSDLTYGMMVCDRRPPEYGAVSKHEGPRQPFQAKVVYEMDPEGFFQYLYELVK